MCFGWRPGRRLGRGPAPPPRKRAATLTRAGTEMTLRVNGQNDMGETIDLTVTCR
jgi:hypothetical protein